MANTGKQMKRLLAKYEDKVAATGPPPWRKKKPPRPQSTVSRSKLPRTQAARHVPSDYHDPVHVLVSKPPKIKRHRDVEQAEYERLHAHAFYLTARESSPDEPLVAGDDLDEIVEEAYGVLRNHPKEKPLVVIEAENADEAMRGVGHVWWERGVFRGPPVDPRQKGFNW
jgi:hypothetical protein